LTFLANSTGEVIGPFDPREMHALIEARQYLAREGANVYQVTAQDEQQARQQFRAVGVPHTKPGA
jgi:hypothetical protein